MREEGRGLDIPAPVRLSRVVWRGALVNALNPQTALFFLAFLPQFVGPERGSVVLQTLTLGALFLLLATPGDGTYALLAGSIGKRQQRNRALAPRQKYVTGGVYIALGITTVAAGHPE